MKNARVDLSGESRFFLWRSGLRTTRNRRMAAATSRGPLRLSLRAGFLKKREKGRTPSWFTSTIQETRVRFPALIGPTRQSSETRVGDGTGAVAVEQLSRLLGWRDGENPGE